MCLGGQSLPVLSSSGAHGLDDMGWAWSKVEMEVPSLGRASSGPGRARETRGGGLRPE
ncbi:hypothetical protein DFAR_440004 [Desulfarculales bacterium]